MPIEQARFGTLGIGSGGDFRIRFERELAHPLDRVWNALVDPGKLRVWMPGCVIEPHVGGRVHYDFGDEGAATGVVTGLEAPGERGLLEHTWEWPGVPDSAVLWQLTPAVAGTTLTLTHRELVAEPARDFAIGWHLILDTLERYAAGLEWEDVWDGYEEISAGYASRTVG
ncbi:MULTISPECIES: SRPBCC domain-containing protein [Polymorphospora]|uniref:SRPBCC domain-containing protein n=1 Tax=Polymorphospora lycopeni TaxID=3140240 RepID=A0ABV5CX15_9ACTN